MRPTELPREVAIGPVDYSVVEDADRIFDARHQGDDHRWAQTDKYLTEILLDPRLSPARKRETLLHECIHALLYEWNVDLGYFKEEPLVESLTLLPFAPTRGNRYAR